MCHVFLAQAPKIVPSRKKIHIGRSTNSFRKSTPRSASPHHRRHHYITSTRGNLQMLPNALSLSETTCANETLGMSIEQPIHLESVVQSPSHLAFSSTLKRDPRQPAGNDRNE
jgi:hypothetical protein